MREPALFSWPGTISPAVVHDIGSTLDLLPTFAKLAEAELPADLVLDGADISGALFGTGPSGRDVMFYYRGQELYAVRKGAFKAHFITKPAYGPGKAEHHDPPVLYNLAHDPSEKYDVAADHPDVIAEIIRVAEAHKAAMQPGEPQLEKVIGPK